MSEKIIFLDVDGVLNYMSYRNKSTANIDPSKVEMLAYICTQTNAKVVITSSWRGSETYTPRIYYILLDILKEHHVPVLGDAPYIEGQFTASVDIEKSYSLDEIGDMSFEPSTGRGAEVDKYIKDNNIKQFVIFDDEDWDWTYYGLEEHWCRSTYQDKKYGGLQPGHIKKAIQLLDQLERLMLLQYESFLFPYVNEHTIFETNLLM